MEGGTGPRPRERRRSSPPRTRIRPVTVREWFGRVWRSQPDQEGHVVQGLKQMKMGGLKEALRPKIHISKRALWAFIFGVLAAYGCWLCKNASDDYDAHALHLTRHESTDVANVAMAAVTLCPNFMFKEEKLKEAKRIWAATKAGDKVINGKKWTREDARKLLSFIYHTCQSGRTYLRRSGILRNEIYVGDNLEELVKIYDNHNDSALTDKIIPFLAEGTVDCTKLILVCHWNEVEMEDCSKLFRPTQTDVGQCCSFNKVPDHILREQVHMSNSFGKSLVLASKGSNKDKDDAEWEKWNMDNDESLKDKDAKRNGNGVPKRQLQAGQDYGLSIVVRMGKEPQLCPLSDGNGLMLSIQNPAEQPQIRRYGFLVRPNHETTVQLTTNLVKSTANMEGMKVADRKCYFNDDFAKGEETHKPKFEYSKYTEGNCQEACFALVIQKMCECVPLSLSVSLSVDPKRSNASEKLKVRQMNANDNPYQKEEEEFTTIHVYQKYDDINTEEAQNLRMFIIFVGTIGGILGLTSGFNLMTPFNLAEGLLHIVLSYLKHIPCFKKFYESIFGPYPEDANLDANAIPPIPDSPPQSDHPDEDDTNNSGQPGGENDTVNGEDDTVSTSQVRQDPVVPFDAATPSLPPRSAHRQI
ncbi:Pickpocket protein 28 [Folsomia candida]|uniref:Pickpocket protein 28 n=1 Tax=Folsomia candida TaxID=158441 RepID=A0A226ESB3_FOLCA|nr:Pickpocket protein 28 [Folsomia candida]